MPTAIRQRVPLPARTSHVMAADGCGEVAIEPHAERDPAQQGSCCQPLLPGMAALKTSRTTSVAAGAAVVFGVFGGCEKGLAMTRNWKKG